MHEFIYGKLAKCTMVRVIRAYQYASSTGIPRLPSSYKYSSCICIPQVLQLPVFLDVTPFHRGLGGGGAAEGPTTAAEDEPLRATFSSFSTHTGSFFEVF